MGLSLRQPFWDPDLIECVVRIRPHVRSAGGQAKALVRRPLARRFPGLGFDRRPKSSLGGPFLEVVTAQAGAVHTAIGGIQTLGELGVADPEPVREGLDAALAGRGPAGWLWSIWDILNLEAWARAHC
jgi:hypothetical protein